MTDAPTFTRLYFGPWYRRSLFFESTLRAGCMPAHTVQVESEHGLLTGSTATIPFVDPRKERPAQRLRATA